MKTNWNTLLKEEMDAQGESELEIVSTTLTPEDAARMFDAGYGGTEGEPFTVWSQNRVYFPVQYDGSEWVSSVSRNPDGKATAHVGGG